MLRECFTCYVDAWSVNNSTEARERCSHLHTRHFFKNPVLLNMACFCFVYKCFGLIVYGSLPFKVAMATKCLHVYLYVTWRTTKVVCSKIPIFQSPFPSDLRQGSVMIIFLRGGGIVLDEIYALYLKPLANIRPKYIIFDTFFQIWPCNIYTHSNQSDRVLSSLKSNDRLLVTSKAQNCSLLH